MPLLAIWGVVAAALAVSIFNLPAGHSSAVSPHVDPALKLKASRSLYLQARISQMIFALGVFYAFLALDGFLGLLFIFVRLHPGTEVHLAVHPRCGSLGESVSDVNAGVILASVRTIVSFGDSYTDGGRHDGGPLAPAVMNLPNPFAGGRSTNGKLWVEHLADSVGATLMDYAWSSAVTNISLWPSNPYPRDFIMQTEMFLDQSHELDPATTLYTVFFGINDWVDSFYDGNHLPEAAHDLLNQIALLSQPPTNARNFLVTDVYGRGIQNAWGQNWLQIIFDGLNAFHSQIPPLNVAFANFATIWDGVLGSDPGHKAFGYVSTDACYTQHGVCSDPDHYFYWFPGHPSRVTHKIMADYVREVLDNC